MGDTDLIWALKNGDLEEVKAKLVTCEDVNRTLDGGRKPLHYAADFNHQDILLYLISKGAEVDAVDTHGLTPLICACYEGHANCVKVLLDKGADKHLKTREGVCPFEAASDFSAIRDLLK